MPDSRRKTIVEYIVTELKNINGEVSTYDASYTYSSDLSNNVFRRLKFIDEVNDFPAIYVSAGTEVRTYNTSGMTTADLDISIRCYINSEESLDALESIFNDIEHILYRLNSPENEILEITIQDLSTDEGLIAPLGIGEISINVEYVLDN